MAKCKGTGTNQLLQLIVKYQAFISFTQHGKNQSATEINRVMKMSINIAKLPSLNSMDLAPLPHRIKRDKDVHSYF